MTCHEARDAIRARAVVPSVDAEEASLEAHLAACTACAGLQRSEDRLTELLRPSSPPVLSRSAHRDIDRAIRGARPAQAPWLAPTGVAAAVVVTLVLVAPLAWRGVSAPALTTQPQVVGVVTPEGPSAPTHVSEAPGESAMATAIAPTVAARSEARPTAARKAQRSQPRGTPAVAVSRAGRSPAVAGRGDPLAAMDTRAIEEALSLPEVTVCLDVRSTDCAFDVAGTEGASRVHSLPGASSVVGVADGPPLVSSISTTEVASP
jgi:hypothetical protein